MRTDRYELEIAAASTDIERTRELARALAGTFYVDAREDHEQLPFRALITVTTDDLSPVAAVADVGLYVICRRLIKAGAPTVIGLFPLVHHPDLTHAEADAHWRDQHAPLALEHHAFMTHYTQLSVVHRISGMQLDGFALCGFASIGDLRNRFYTRESSRAVIADDVQRFADTRRSPRRLIVEETRFGTARETEAAVARH
jgi:EthD domain